MMKVTASKFCKEFHLLHHKAGEEPISVTEKGQVAGYFISENDFLQYQQLKKMSRKAYHPSELPDELVAALENARVPAEYDHLDKMLDK